MRTRFAPSPTGNLHVGGLRTALYAYLLAKKEDGSFILRIEDTDKTREVAGSIEQILDGLTWAGIPPNEGVVLQDEQRAQEGAHGPYIQSERLDLYKEYAQKLIENGNAYYAFDTTEDLDAMRKEEQANGNPAPSYNARIRMRMKNSLTLEADDVKKRLESGESYVIRMKVPETETITFTDDVRGNVSFHGKTVDDQVLMKSDGFPTYHLAHVVDDHFMDIDVIIRGEEWLPSTPKHLLLFQFLGWQPPRYAHLSLLLNADGSKLSKRQGDVSVHDYIEKGYLPEALINFIAFLGWNPGTTQDVFTMQELVDQFSLDRVQKAGAVFDHKKLDWLQGQWMRKLTLEEFKKRIEPLVPEATTDVNFDQKAALIQERITFFHEAPEMLNFFYTTPAPDIELMASKKQKIDAADLPRYLSILEEVLTNISAEDWRAEKMLEDVKAAIEKHDLKLGQLLWPLRALLTGRLFSPGAVEVAEVLGKEETMKRLEAAKTLL